MNSFVISRLDMGNSLLFGIPAYELNRLQKLQNSCARLISGLKRSANVFNLFHELHWLIIKARIIFKVVCFVYKCLHSMAPVYLVIIRDKNDTDLTQVKPRSSRTHGYRAFSSCGPVLWNV